MGNRHNTICPICGTSFHACDSCGLHSFWEYRYCSDDCWSKSEEYIKQKTSFGILYNKLKKDNLLDLFLDIVDMDDDYIKEVNESWIAELEGVEL